MERNWSTVGADLVERVGGREAVEDKMMRMEWLAVTKEDEGVTVGFMQGSAVNKAIVEFRIPKVSAISVNESFSVDDDDGDGFYPGLYGIEGNYTNGRVRVYVLDDGCKLTPLASELY